MKRREFILAGSAATVAGLTGSALLPRRSAADSHLELRQPGVLTAAAEGTYPPFSFRNQDGEFDGIGRKSMVEICRRLELEFDPVITKWETLLVGLLADKFDIISSAMGITAERQESVTFCDAWVESGSKLFVHADSSIMSSSEASGKRVGAIVASIFVPVAEALVGDSGKVLTYQTDVDGMRDVINGNIDGIILDAIAGSYALKNAGLPLRPMPEFQQSYQLGWAVQKGKPNLVKAVNAAHWDMVADGTFAEICEPLIGFDPTPKDPIRSIL